MKVIRDYILTLDFVKEKHINIWKTHQQSQAIYVDNLFFTKSLHILEDGAISVQVDILDT